MSVHTFAVIIPALIAGIAGYMIKDIGLSLLLFTLLAVASIIRIKRT